MFSVHIFNGTTMINKCAFVDAFKATAHFNSLIPYYKRLGDSYKLDLVMNNGRVIRTTK